MSAAMDTNDAQFNAIAETDPTAVRAPGERLLRLREVQQKLGISRGAIYDRMAKDALPRPLQVGPGTVRWRESEIDAWIRGLPRA